MNCIINFKVLAVRDSKVFADQLITELRLVGCIVLCCVGSFTSHYISRLKPIEQLVLLLYIVRVAVPS